MKKIWFSLFASCSSLLVQAQDNEGSEVSFEDINDKWYASPWVWVAGAALIIVLLVVLSQSKDYKA